MSQPENPRLQCTQPSCISTFKDVVNQKKHLRDMHGIKHESTRPKSYCRWCTRMHENTNFDKCKKKYLRDQQIAVAAPGVPALTTILPARPILQQRETLAALKRKNTPDETIVSREPSTMSNSKRPRLAPMAGQSRTFPVLPPVPKFSCACKDHGSDLVNIGTKGKPELVLTAKAEFDEATLQITAHSKPAKAAYIDSPEDADILVLRTVDEVQEYLSKPLLKMGLVLPGSEAMQKIEEHYRTCSAEELFEEEWVKPGKQWFHAQLNNNGVARHTTLLAQDVVEQFKTPEGREPFNILDFGIATPFTPMQLVKLDICRAADKSFRNEASLSRNAKTLTTGKSIENWALISCEGTSSPIHVDNPPMHTHIRIHKGSKVWTFLVNPTLEDWETHKSQTFPDKFLAKFRHVLLEEGTFMIQPAGTLHHVWTPKDCVATGGFFMTAKSMGLSLRVGLFTDGCNACTNDWPIDQIFRYFDFYLSICTREKVIEKYELTAAEIKDVKDALSLFPKTVSGRGGHIKRKRKFIQEIEKNEVVQKLEKQIVRLKTVAMSLS